MRYPVNHLCEVDVCQEFDARSQVPPTGVSGVFDHQREPNPEPVPEEEHDGET